MSIKGFNEYQQFTKDCASYNTEVEIRIDQVSHFYAPWAYPAFALAEEAGEVCGKVAKFIRKSNSLIGVEQQEAHGKLRDDIGKELGDVLYQVSETARQFGYTMQEIVDMNYDKLKDRIARGVLIGEGDNR